MVAAQKIMPEMVAAQKFLPEMVAAQKCLPEIVSEPKFLPKVLASLKPNQALVCSISWSCHHGLDSQFPERFTGSDP
jgi:hypothetical protein